MAAESAAAPSVMAFTTPSVTQGGIFAGAGAGGVGSGAGAGAGAAAGAGGAGGTGGLSGSLAGTSFDYGTPAMLAEADAAAAAVPEPGMLAQVGGYAKTAMKGAAAYSRMNQAMGGNQPPQQAPQGRPIFQGEPAPIAPQVRAQKPPDQRTLLAQIARRRQLGI